MGKSFGGALMAAAVPALQMQTANLMEQAKRKREDNLLRMEREYQTGRDTAAATAAMARQKQSGADQMAATQAQIDAKKDAVETANRFTLENRGSGSMLGSRELTMKEVSELPEGQLSQLKDKGDYQIAQAKAVKIAEGEIAIENAKQAYELAKDQAQESREEIVAAIQASPGFKDKPEAVQEKIVFTARFPEVAEALAKANKLDKFPVEEFSRTYMWAADAWNTMDDTAKAPIIQRAADRGIVDTDGVKDFYAKEQAAKATGLDVGTISQPTNYSPEDDIPRLLAMNPAEQKVAMDKIKAADPELYRRVSSDLARGANQARPDEGPGMLSRAGSMLKGAGGAILDYGGRNSPGGRNVEAAAALSDLKKEYPGMTQMFYDLKMKERQ